jgi:hypothetical protein
MAVLGVEADTRLQLGRRSPSSVPQLHRHDTSIRSTEEELAGDEER